MTTFTQKFIDEFKSMINLEKEYTRSELSKCITTAYNKITQSNKEKSKSKNNKLCYSLFGSEYNIESLSESVIKTLSKFESDDVKEHWRKYGDWVYVNKDYFKDGAHRFHKGDNHERHLSQQKIEFKLYDSIQKGKDVKDTETLVSMENKNIQYIKTKNLIKFRLWNFHTSKNEDFYTVYERKIKNNEKADIYVLSDENMTVIIPSELFIHNKEYFKYKSDGIDIYIPFSKCKTIWIRDFTKDIDWTQKINIKEQYEKFLEAT
jgi:hypothetical protein